MQNYIIRELQDSQSYRVGQTIKAKNLSAAKQAATKGKMFKGTVLVIENEHGVALSVKENGKWY